MLLVSGILENAAAVAPDAVAATLDDDALTFGEIDAAGEPDRARAARERGIGRGRPGAVVGRHDARGGPRVRGAGQDRRGVRAAERARRRSRRSRRSPSTPGRGCCSPARRTPSARSELAAAPRRSVRRERDRAAAAVEPPAGGRRSTSATRTSSSSRAGAPAGRRASCSRTARTGCARSWARPRRPGGGGTVCMFPLFHMAGWTIALGAWQARRAVHFVRVPDAATLLDDHGPPPRGPALLHPRGVGARARARRRRATTCRRSSKPTPARRRRRPSCSPRSRTRCPTP